MRRRDGVRASRRSRTAVWFVGVALLGIVAAGCIPEPPLPEGQITEVSVSTTPGLFPAFSPDILDYVVRCAGDPIHVAVDTPDSHPITVDGSEPATGRIVADVAKTGGQGFEIVDTALLRAYEVRCLPSDYPTFAVTRNRAPQAEYFLTAPIGIGFPIQPEYVTIFDDNGVPVWWSKTRLPVVFADLFDNGNLGYVRFDNQPSEEHTLSGALVRTIASNAQPVGAQFDQHDLLRLANGHYVYVYNYARSGVDLRAVFPNHSGDASLASASVLDHVLVEVDASGNPVWTWDAYDHIPPTEMDPQWEQSVYSGLHPNGYDVYHWNSVDTMPNGYLLSFRHLDAVYAIDQGTGNIVWKLGGSARPESLTVQDDPVFTGSSHFGGQHDARMLADGTVTLHDNGTDLGRAPRGVRYELALNDPAGTGGTATLVEQVSDPTDAPSSFCCGSARRLPGGDWVFGFGSTGVIAELGPSGDIVLRITFDPPVAEYRTVPIAFGRLNRLVLRAAMNAQNP